MSQLTNYQPQQNRHNISFADRLFYGPARRNGANQSKRGLPFHPITLVNLGAPALASATKSVNAQAVAGAGAVTLTATPNPDVPRTLQYVSSGAGDTTQTVTVTGTDTYGQVMTERVNLNGVTVVHGKKAFATVTGVVASAALAGNLSVGTDTKLGLPYCIGGKHDILAAYATDTVDTTGTWTAQDTTSPATATTGDVRGTFDPALAPDGARIYRAYMKVYDHTSDIGSYGVTQA